MTPMVKREAPADTRRTEGGPDRIELEEVGEDHRMIQNQVEEMGLMEGAGEDVDPEATQDHRARRDLGDLQGPLDRKETRDKSQGWEI